MSKFLKVIVNLFLICAILVGAAILVPPLMGISTTVIDSSSMDTNLPVGSVTYAKDADVTEIEIGDKVLSERDAKIYVYEVEEANAASGKFIVRNTRNTSGQTEEITLRNIVPQVVVTVPFIGYVMMAMHSVEGLIIIGLVVLFIIILFILSELWKKPDEDEDEDEEENEAEGEDERAEAAFGKGAANQVPKKETVVSDDVMSEEEALALAREELARAVAESRGREAASQNAVEQDASGIDHARKASQTQEVVSMEEAEPAKEEPEVTDSNTFIPVARLSAAELLKKAEASSEEPVVTKDETSGVTILDYSDII